MYCSKCGAEYKQGDRFCGTCGTDVTLKHELGNIKVKDYSTNSDNSKDYQFKRKSNKKTWIIVGCILISLVIINGQITNHNAQSNNNVNASSSTPIIAQPSVTKTEPIAPVITAKVTSIDLYNEYNTNVLRADKLYKDKLIEITGYITNISNSWNIPSVSLNIDGNMFNNVTCKFKGQTQIDNITKLNIGDKVVFRGTCTGQTMGSIFLEKCQVITYTTTTKQ